MDSLSLFGLFAVTLMLVFYALEDRSPWFILAFAVSLWAQGWLGRLEARRKASAMNLLRSETFGGAIGRQSVAWPRAVSKAVVRVTVPWVRIPPSPPVFFEVSFTC